MHPEDEQPVAGNGDDVTEPQPPAWPGQETGSSADRGWGFPPSEPAPPSQSGPPPSGVWSQAPYPPAGPPERPPRRARTVLAAILAGTVLLSAGIGIGWGLTRTVITTSPQTAEAPIRTIPQPSSSADRTLSLQQIEDKVDPAVVDVVSVFDPAALGAGTGTSNSRRTEGAGTGMILTPTGQILTNNHVIAGSTSIKVSIEGRSGTFDATVVGADPTDDVALIQIQGVSGLPTVTLADATTLMVGDRVVAIGNALGRGGTPTATEGSVTALNQAITAGGGSGGPERLTRLIETDASIAPGDSGGPLVNSAGQVVGMITASARIGRLRPSSSNQGYAITVNVALDVVNDIRAGRESSGVILGKTGFLGVEVENLDQAKATELGLGVSSGALVVGVLSGTPAEKAGISKNSVITAIDGNSIGSTDALGPALHSHDPGDTVRVTWIDGTGSHTASVQLIAGPAV